MPSNALKQSRSPATTKYHVLMLSSYVYPTKPHLIATSIHCPQRVKITSNNQESYSGCLHGTYIQPNHSLYTLDTFTVPVCSQNHSSIPRGAEERPSITARSHYRHCLLETEKDLRMSPVPVNIYISQLKVPMRSNQ